MADQFKVQDEIVGLMDRLAHKENPCKMGSSSYDNQICNIFTGNLLRDMSSCWPWKLSFSLVVLGVAAVERQMGVDNNRLAVGRPYTFNDS